jgi:hypothetical protein
MHCGNSVVQARTADIYHQTVGFFMNLEVVETKFRQSRDADEIQRGAGIDGKSEFFNGLLAGSSHQTQPSGT